MINNSAMIHEPKSTLEATQRVVKILDSKQYKANLNAVVNENFSHLQSREVAEAPH
jgi:P2-related tail formation protein